MRVLAIGGAGAMGRRACRLAARSDAVRRLTVTDLSADAAAGVARELGRDTVGIGLDLTDAAALRQSLRDIDAVLNVAGPFYRFGSLVLAAAIDAGCHYLDICDDGEPTSAMLALDGRARAAGVTAILGLGASPGISNLLAMLAMRELDVPDRLVTGWSLDGAGQPPAGSGPHAATLHGIRQATGTIPVMRAGARSDERPLRTQVIDYPGVGRRRAVTFGHPEPVTLTRTFPQLRECVNVTHGSRSAVALLRSIGRAVDHRLLAAERAAGWVERAAGWAERASGWAERASGWAERAEPRPGPDPARLFRADSLPPLFALASGLRDGRAASVGVALAGFPGTTMSALTGTPIAVALELLAVGAVTRRGVFPPEAAVDPDGFLTAFARHCQGSPTPDQMRIVTRSWDPDAADVYRQDVAMAQARVASARPQGPLP